MVVVRGVGDQPFGIARRAAKDLCPYLLFARQALIFYPDLPNNIIKHRYIEVPTVARADKVSIFL